MQTDSENPGGTAPKEHEPFLPLFPDFKRGTGKSPRTYRRIQHPIWTENKAHFIQAYLRYFVQITKHGAYIDGFAGPQSYKHLDAWCASLVLESEPKWLRKFFLCEQSKVGIRALRRLKERQLEPRDKKGRTLPRTIEIHPGDFNIKINTILQSGRITQKEATFCLLDQRTFECHWSTVETLAKYKQAPHNKIEILYFLGIGWLHRALSGIRKKERATKWWGNPDWPQLKTMSSHDIADFVRQRFQNELGYKYVAAYPIYDRARGNRVMYYMIHASDHEEAPALMVRAHSRAVRAKPPIQNELFSKTDLTTET